MAEIEAEARRVPSRLYSWETLTQLADREIGSGISWDFRR
jgi:hypothetical protein